MATDGVRRDPQPVFAKKLCSPPIMVAALASLVALGAAFSFPHSQKLLCNFFSKTLPQAYQHNTAVQSTTAGVGGLILGLGLYHLKKSYQNGRKTRKARTVEQVADFLITKNPIWTQPYVWHLNNKEIAALQNQIGNRMLTLDDVVLEESGRVSFPRKEARLQYSRVYSYIAPQENITRIEGVALGLIIAVGFGLFLAFYVHASRDAICQFFKKTFPNAYKHNLIVQSVSLGAAGFGLAYNLTPSSEKKKKPPIEKHIKRFRHLIKKLKAPNWHLAVDEYKHLLAELRSVDPKILAAHLTVDELEQLFRRPKSDGQFHLYDKNAGAILLKSDEDFAKSKQSDAWIKAFILERSEAILAIRYNRPYSI